jgi:hypothetical protein
MPCWNGKYLGASATFVKSFKHEQPDFAYNCLKARIRCDPERLGRKLFLCEFTHPPSLRFSCLPACPVA